MICEKKEAAKEGRKGCKKVVRTAMLYGLESGTAEKTSGRAGGGGRGGGPTVGGRGGHMDLQPGHHGEE